MKQIKKLNFYYAALFIWVGVGQINAQDFQVYPKVCYFSPNEIVKMNITSQKVEFSINNSDCPNKLLVTSSNVIFQQGSPVMYQKSIIVSKNKIEMEINPQTLFLEGFYNMVVGSGEPCAYECKNCVEFKKRRIYTTNISIQNDRYKIKTLLVGSGYTFAYNESLKNDTNLFLTKDNILFNSENTLNIPDVALTRISKDTLMVEATSVYPLWQGWYSISLNNMTNIQIEPAFYLKAPQIKAVLEQPVSGTKTKFRLTIENFKFSTTEASNCISKLNVQASDVVFTAASNTLTTLSVSDVQIKDSIITGYLQLPANMDNFTATLLNRQGCNIAASDPLAISPISQIYYTPKLQIANPTIGIKSRFQINIPNIKFVNTGIGDCVSKLKVTASNVIFSSASGVLDLSSSISNVTVGDSVITGDILINDRMYNIYARVNNADGCNGNISNQVAVLPAVLNPKIYTVSTAEAGRGEVMNIKASVASNLYFLKSGISDCSKNGLSNYQEASINPKDLEITNGIVSYMVDSSSVLFANNFPINSISIDWKVPQNATIGNYRLVLRKGVGCNFESKETVAVICRDTSVEKLEIIGPKEVCKNTTHTYKIKSFMDHKYIWKVYTGNHVLLESQLNGDSISINFDHNKIIVLSAENSCGKVINKEIALNIDTPVDETLPYQIAGEDSSIVNGIKAYLPYTTEQSNNYNQASEMYTRVQYKWAWKVLSGGILNDSIPQDSLMPNMAIVKWTQPGTHQLSATPYNSCSFGKPHLFNVVVGTKSAKPIIYTDVAFKFYNVDQKYFRVFSSTVGGVHDWNLTLINSSAADSITNNKLLFLNKSWKTTIRVDGIQVYYAKLSEVIPASGSAPRTSDSISIRVYPLILSKENYNISDHSTVTVDCYPNPVSQSLTISLKNWEAKKIQISLVDELGKEVYAYNNATAVNLIDVSKLENGIYLLKISNGEVLKLQKIYIQK